MNISAEILLFGETDPPVVKALEEPIHQISHNFVPNGFHQDMQLLPRKCQHFGAVVLLALARGGATAR